MTPADEITAAAEKLRTMRFAGAMTATPVVAALIAAREPLAKFLRELAALHEHDARPGHGGCQWCADEDWPCNDVRNALSMARQINRTEP